MASFGFIITRHVNSVQTNKYWNQSIKLLRGFYPHRKIVIIDDNSNQEFVKAEHNYKNIEYIQSEYPARGELLPYIYFYRNKWFNNAIIIHDSIFFHKRINFEKFKFEVLPLWHFGAFDDNLFNSINVARVLKHNRQIIDILNKPNEVNFIGFSEKKWEGCFGVQCYINHNFLVKIYNKYGIGNLVNSVSNRTDRCSLERIFGIIFSLESPNVLKLKSILGDIQRYHRWGYDWEEYYHDFLSKRVPRPVIKVFTGR